MAQYILEKIPPQAGGKYVAGEIPQSVGCKTVLDSCTGTIEQFKIFNNNMFAVDAFGQRVFFFFTCTYPPLRLAFKNIKKLNKSIL